MELKIAVSDSDLGGISEELISSIVSCTTRIPESRISINTFPSLRGKQELLNLSVDGYYPMTYKPKEDQNGLFPLYIDEVLMISEKRASSKPISLGLVRGDNSHYLKRLKNYKLSFSGQNSRTLLRALVDNRADAIIIKRSEIPAAFSLDNYTLTSLEYVESGIELNSNFYIKSKMNKNEVELRYLNCLQKVNFTLKHERKDSIAKQLSMDVANLQRSFQISRKSISDIKQKDKIWRSRSQDKAFIQEILDSKESQKLKSLLSDMKFVTEAFVFNYQGAVLGELSKSSDFDQSDEEKYKLIKYQKIFNRNNITDIYFDSSSRSFQIGIMIRLEDSRGKFSGGVFIGANINRLLTHYNIN